MKLIITFLLVSCGATPMFASDEKLVTIGFMGDVMLGRKVNEKIAQTSFEYPWGDFLPLLKRNDLNIVNLECALTTSTCIVPKIFNFKAKPDRVKVLVAGSIGVVNNANNHILDYSYDGMEETLKVLDKAGIKHVGAGKNREAAQKLFIVERKGIKIGIIGCTDNEHGWIAGKLKPGTNYFDVEEPKPILTLVKKLKASVDILIVTMHWGPNMRQRPTKQFVHFAHALIDAGADIIHGHSAHLIQPLEVYKGKLIMYDTGDFIDDYMVDPLLRNDQTCLFRVTISKKAIKKVRLIPGIIDNMQVNRAPKEKAADIIRTLQKRSIGFDTIIKNQELVLNPGAKSHVISS